MHATMMSVWDRGALWPYRAL